MTQSLGFSSFHEVTACIWCYSLPYINTTIGSHGEKRERVRESSSRAYLIEQPRKQGIGRNWGGEEVMEQHELSSSSSSSEPSSPSFSSSSSSSSSSSLLRQCRICHEEEDEWCAAIESPCGCSGSLKVGTKLQADQVIIHPWSFPAFLVVVTCMIWFLWWLIY